MAAKFPLLIDALKQFADHLQGHSAHPHTAFCRRLFTSRADTVYLPVSDAPEWCNSGEYLIPPVAEKTAQPHVLRLSWQIPLH